MNAVNTKYRRKPEPGSAGKSITGFGSF